MCSPRPVKNSFGHRSSDLRFLAVAPRSARAPAAPAGRHNRACPCAAPPGCATGRRPARPVMPATSSSRASVSISTLTYVRRGSGSCSAACQTASSSAGSGSRSGWKSISTRSRLSSLGSLMRSSGIDRDQVALDREAHQRLQVADQLVAHGRVPGIRQPLIEPYASALAIVSTARAPSPG